MRYSNDELNRIIDRVKIIVDLTNEIYSVEDRFLEIWLMEGMPDGSSISEIVDFVTDDETYADWVRLATKLIKAREEDDEEEDY